MDHIIIPVEMIYYIYDMLTPKYLLECRLLCKSSKNYIDSNNKIWRNLFSKHHDKYIQSGKEIITNDNLVFPDTLLKSLGHACYMKDVDIVKFLINIFLQGNWNTDLCCIVTIHNLIDNMICSGNPEIVDIVESTIKCSRINGGKRSMSIINEIIEHGNGKILNYYITKYPLIRKNMTRSNIDLYIHNAYVTNNASVLKILLAYYKKDDENTEKYVIRYIISACRMGRKSVVKVSIDEYNFDKQAFIQKGNLGKIFTHSDIHILKWIIKRLNINKEDIKLNKPQINRLYNDDSNCAKWIIKKFDL
jgi:hypothetical protein